MAIVTTALAQVFSFLRPLASHPPRALADEIGGQGAPIRAAAPDSEANQGLSSLSSPSSSTVPPTFEEPRKDERRRPWGSDPFSFLIEKMDQEWFTDNVMRCRWPRWGRWHGAAARERPGGSALWGPDASRQSSEAAKLIVSEGNFGCSSVADCGPDAGGGAGGARLQSIEMVQPLAGPSQRDWDSRGLPGSRLRRLSRAEEADASDATMAGAAACRRPVSSLRSCRSRSEDMSGAFGCFADKRPEIGASAMAERPTSGVDAGPAAAAFPERERRRAGPGDGLSIPPPPTRRRRRDRRKSSKSSTDEEYDELRGFIDLGFNFDPEDLTPRVVDLLPGLKSYRSGDYDLLESPQRSSPRARTHSPRGWPTRPDSPLLNWHIPSSQDGSVDMKAHLKFWAHSVASSVSAEC